ncbi:hypothetical protein K2173_003454 [Erythroxylum novogranatense]|uniref:Uncharacterized protein n=1 Tax=Erythroxylum novogranatense TaxID=1862640 RepID=A0AAV8S936_9ROSI|nr:hypothetical protein K2173_003454 [Erythroxylum novogranatense]
MWTMSPLPPRPFAVATKPTGLLFPAVFSARSQPSDDRASAAPKKKPQKKEQERGTNKPEIPKQESGGLSGLDVLWAMQKAASEKNKRNDDKKGKKKRVLSAAENRKEEDNNMDYGNARPLCIKRDWSIRLDQLEKRLNDLSQKSERT